MVEQKAPTAVGVEHVKSAYRSSSKRPKPISKRGYTLNIFKVSMYTKPTESITMHKKWSRGQTLCSHSLLFTCCGSISESPDVDFVLEVCEQLALPN